MPLLRVGKKAVALKRGPLYAAIVTLLCITIFCIVQSSTWLTGVSCADESSNSQLLGQALQSITALAQRSKPSELAVGANGTEALQDQDEINGVHLATIPRAVRPTLDSRMQVTVPLSIWQSLTIRDGSTLAVSTLFNSWTVHHPEWDHFLVDAEDMRSYVQERVEPALVELFWSMPTEEMRTDAFRYLVLYQHGGVHADIDTLCLRPAKAWAPRGCLVSVAAAGPDSLSPAAIASVAGHGAIGAVVQLMWQRMGDVTALLESGADLDTVAYNTTGAGVLTDGVVKYLGGEQPADVAALLAQAPRLRSNGVCLLTAEEMQSFITKAGAAWDPTGASERV